MPGSSLALSGPLSQTKLLHFQDSVKCTSVNGQRETKVQFRKRTLSRHDPLPSGVSSALRFNRPVYGSTHEELLKLRATQSLGHAVAQLVEALRYTSEGRGVRLPMVSME